MRLAGLLTVYCTRMVLIPDPLGRTKHKNMKKGRNQSGRGMLQRRRIFLEEISTSPISHITFQTSV